MSSVSSLVQGLVDARLIFPDLRERTLEGALSELSRDVAAAGVVRDPEALAARLVRREKDGCTGLGGGVAIPHCRTRDIGDVVLAIGVSREGVDFGAPDGLPVTVFFLLLSPMDAPALHLQSLARVSRLVRTPGLIDALRAATSADEIAEALRAAEGPASRATV